MRIHFSNLLTSTQSSALMAVVAILLAGMLAKLGHEWWGIATMVGPYLLDARSNGPAGDPGRVSGQPLG